MTDVSGLPQESGRGRLTPQLVFGLLVIAVGVLFTLDNLGIADAGAYVRYWPVGLIGIGLVKIWQSPDVSGGGFWGLLLTFAGVWLLLEELAVIRISLGDLWPLLLVLLGVYLVWHGVSAARQESTPDQADESTLSAMAILGAVERGSNSRAFRSADLTAIMGGCEIDLRHAAINGEAVIDVFAMWGGIEVRVPDDWTVESRVVPVLGGVEDKTRPPQGATTHRLILRGFALMGGIEVKN